MNKAIRLISLFLCLFFLSSCALVFRDPIFRYSGEYVDLEAAAIHSVPGVYSRSSHQIVPLETDLYGRRMYVSYKPSSCLSFGYDYGHVAIVFSLLIVQKTENDMVYFYGDQNYLFVFLPEGTALTTDLVEEYFTEEDILTLKQVNMWNEPFSESDPNLCAVPVSVEKSEIMTDACKEIVCDKVGEKNIRWEFLRKDANGKSMYFVLSIVGVKPTKYIWYITMFDEDGTLVNGDQGIRELDQSKNIPQQILEFRMENGWKNK